MIGSAEVGLFSLYNQAHIFHFALMLGGGSNDIDACGVDARMTENVSELGNILFNTVKGTGKQVSKIMRKHL